jgi:hypothetical protein
MHALGRASNRYTPAPVGLYSPGVGSLDEPDMHSVTPPDENTLAVPMPPLKTFSGRPPLNTLYGEVALEGRESAIASVWELLFVLATKLYTQ